MPAGSQTIIVTYVYSYHFLLADANLYDLKLLLTDIHATAFTVVL